MALFAKYRNGIVNLGNAQSVVNMLESEMVHMFGEDIYYEFARLMEEQRGISIVDDLKDRIENDMTLHSFLHMVTWSDMTIGEVEFSRFDDVFFKIIDSATESKTFQYKKDGVVIMQEIM